MDYNITYREKDKGIQVIISYKDNRGKWKQKSKQGFPNNREGKKKAKLEADKMLQELKNTIANSTYNEFKNITLGEFIDLHLDHLKIHLEANTIISYKTSLKHFESIYDLELAKVRSIDIQKCIDNLVEQKYKYGTIKCYVQKLKAIFNSAINKYEIPIKNPTTKLTIEKEKQASNKKALTDTELNQLLQQINHEKYYLIVLLASKCGLRIGEILGLTWSDIDFQNATLSVNKQWKLLKNNTYGFGELKSKNSNRIIPLTTSMIKELKYIKANSVYSIDGRLVPVKNTASTTVCVNQYLKKFNYNISIHELRHTFATNLIANGVDFKTAAQLLGHDVEETMRTYSHVTEDMLKKATQIMENIF